MFTESYAGRLPSEIVDRFEVLETRNATAKIAATNPEPFQDIVDAASAFRFSRDDVLIPGGQETAVAARLNDGFRSRGWRETMYVTTTGFKQVKKGHPNTADVTEVNLDAIEAESYWIDNVKDRVVLDIEWNAKDGNLYRDVSFYRLLHRYDMVDAAVMITRTQDDLRALGRDLGRDNFLSTTTTTNVDKLYPILARGEGDECPILVLAITARCFDPAY